MGDDRGFINGLRWKLTVKFMKWAVLVAPPGDAAIALHNHHLAWCAECRKQWALRYGTESAHG